jgi:galactonate dehydratase
MRIADYELFEIPPSSLLLKLETADGMAGWGEPSIPPYSNPTRAVIEELMEEYLLGKDPLRIEDHWQALFRGGYYRNGPVLMTAIGGIDQALWDLKGKHYGAPVYEFLGGRCRDRIRVYKWIGGDREQSLRSEAERALDEGFSAVKLDATERVNHIDAPQVTNEVRDRIETVREIVGDEVDICVDFRGRTSKTMAKRLAKHLEAYDPMFIEEPLSPQNLPFFPELARHTTAPLALGERLYTRWDFKPLFDTGLLDVAQPDISHAGGISEVTKIAHMAEASGVAIAQSRPMNPLAFAATLQVSASIPNHLIHDFGFQDEEGAHAYADFSPFDLDNGYLDIPEKPGLGLDIDEDSVRELGELDSKEGYPLWRHSDGSVAEF